MSPPKKYNIICCVCRKPVPDWWYKCLICTFASCKTCHDKKPNNRFHPTSHALQKILEQSVAKLHFLIYNCPWCGVLLFTVENVYDHIIDNHRGPRWPNDVFCPICMAIPGWRLLKTSNIEEHMRVRHNCFTKPKVRFLHKKNLYKPKKPSL